MIHQEEKAMTQISRRSLFGKASAGAVALGLGSLVTTVSAAEADKIKWDETTGFVIVGTGFAGLAAHSKHIISA